MIVGKKFFKMANKIILVDDTTVAEVRETRNIYGKTQLVARKAQLEASLEQVNELLSKFP